MTRRIISMPPARRFRINAIAAFLITVFLAGTFFLVSPPRVQGISSTIVISQVYGGGGNSGATFTHDFIELFNKGTSPVSLNGWSVQYTSATGTGNFGGNSTLITELPNVTLQPGQYFLIQEATQAAVGSPLPTPDVVDASPIAMAAGAGKVALVNSTASLGCNGGSTPCSPAALATIVDLVGYGNANFFEGSGTAPTLTNTTSASRKDSGCTDTDNNSADFTAGAPAPRNTSSSLHTCDGDTAPSVSTTSPASGATNIATNASIDINFSEPVNVAGSWFTITGATSGSHTAAVSGGPQSFTLNPDIDFANNETVSVTISASLVTDQDANDPPDNMLANFNFSFTTAAPPPPLKAIHEIQGSGTSSPFDGQVVTTSGIVTGVKSGSSGGFFIQAPDASIDIDPNTSEGVFVFSGNSLPAGAVIGNSVTVTGTVQEFIPSVDPNSPPITEISGPLTVSVNSSGNPLPAAITLTATDTNPAGSIEQLERFEGMRVFVGSMTVIAPTQGNKSEANATSTSNGVFYGVMTGIARPFREPGIEVPDPLPAGSPCCIPRFDANPERLRVDSDGQPGTSPLNVTTGATVTNITGPLDYGFRTYTILPDAATPPSATGNISAAAVPVPGAGQFTVASFNMERFYDTVNDPATSDVVLTATAFNNRLNKASLAIRNVMRTPDIIGVVEMENLATLQAVANKINNDAVAAGAANPNYQPFLVEGNDIGGIDVGFLVKGSPRVNVIDVTQEGKNTTYINPNNGQPELLNDRPSLVLRATIQGPTGPALPVTVIVNHLRSLTDVDDPVDGNRVRVKRRAQAEFLANLIQARQSANPNERIISVGDYNAFQFNDGYGDSIGTIKGTPAPADQVVLASSDLVNPDLTDLVDLAPADQRYSFSFDGNAQELDHILVTGNMLELTSALHYARSNADFPEVFRSDATRPERLADHDMPVAYFAFPATDLSISKTASSSSVQTGAQFSYTITVTNNGTVTATDVVVSDNLPAEVSFDSCSSNGGGICGGSGNNRTITFDSIGAGSSAVVTVTATLSCSVANGTLISNTATVSSATTDTDSNNNSFSASITASNTPPEITCPGNIVQSTDAGQCLAVVSYTSPTPADNCAGTIVVCSPVSGSVFPKGVTTVTCTATDSGGATASCSFTVTVNDTEAPVITGESATPSVLSPPNHKMVNVTVSYNVTDNCGPVTSSLSVSSNEPVNGTEDGDTGPDWIVVDAHHLKLRAERSGMGSGRVYTITITSTDGSGNTSSKVVTVAVPLN